MYGVGFRPLAEGFLIGKRHPGLVGARLWFPCTKAANVLLALGVATNLAITAQASRSHYVPVAPAFGLGATRHKGLTVV